MIFLSEAIAALAFRSRVENAGGGIRRDRIARNLLSSQPMCFNLFGPMAERGDLGASMLEALNRHLPRGTKNRHDGG